MTSTWEYLISVEAGGVSTDEHRAYLDVPAEVTH